MLGIVSISAMSMLACAGSSPSSAMLAPSPIIIPAAVTISVGAAQVFSVQNVTVVRFDVTADRQNWSECVAADSTLCRPTVSGGRAQPLPWGPCMCLPVGTIVARGAKEL
jgi:hypothetical protein